MLSFVQGEEDPPQGFSAVEFRPKLHPSRRALCHRRGAVHLLKEGAKQTKGGAGPCYDALAEALLQKSYLMIVRN